MTFFDKIQSLYDKGKQYVRDVTKANEKAFGETFSAAATSLTVTLGACVLITLPFVAFAHLGVLAGIGVSIVSLAAAPFTAGMANQATEHLTEVRSARFDKKREYLPVQEEAKVSVNKEAATDFKNAAVAPDDASPIPAKPEPTRVRAVSDAGYEQKRA